MFALPLLLALVAAPAPAAAAGAPAPPVAMTADADGRLGTELTKLAGTAVGQSPGLAVAIVEDGKIVYDRAFGHATVDTRFCIGSITKMFTAVALMQLVEAHRVELDARVATYLPDAPHAAQMTVRQLLEHTSGLWNYGDYAFASGMVAEPTTPDQILALAAGHPLTARPGALWAYSNTGYVELGLIVERVTGESLDAYEQRRIFDPAAMHETTFGRPPSATPVAIGYDSAAGPVAAAFDPSWLFADGDIFSTAADLARFDIALMNGTLVSAHTFTQMQSDAVSMGSAAASQGLGLEMVDAAGLRFVGHHGGVPGFAAENETIPASRYAMIVLSDASDFHTRRANAAIVSTLFPHMVPADAGTATPAEDPAITAKFRSAVAGLLRGAVDRTQYSTEANAALTPALLAQTAAQLSPLGAIEKTSYIGQSAVPPGTAYKYDVLFSAGRTVRWQFVIDANGKISGIFIVGGDAG